MDVGWSGGNDGVRQLRMALVANEPSSVHAFERAWTVWLAAPTAGAACWLDGGQGWAAVLQPDVQLANVLYMAAAGFLSTAMPAVLAGRIATAGQMREAFVVWASRCSGQALAARSGGSPGQCSACISAAIDRMTASAPMASGENAAAMSADWLCGEHRASIVPIAELLDRIRLALAAAGIASNWEESGHDKPIISAVKSAFDLPVAIGPSLRAMLTGSLVTGALGGAVLPGLLGVSSFGAVDRMSPSQPRIELALLETEPVLVATAVEFVAPERPRSKPQPVQEQPRAAAPSRSAPAPSTPPGKRVTAPISGETKPPTPVANAAGPASGSPIGPVIAKDSPASIPNTEREAVSPVGTDKPAGPVADATGTPVGPVIEKGKRNGPDGPAGTHVVGPVASNSPPRGKAKDRAGARPDGGAGPAVVDEAELIRALGVSKDTVRTTLDAMQINGERQRVVAVGEVQVTIVVVAGQIRMSARGGSLTRDVAVKALQRARVP